MFSIKKKPYYVTFFVTSRCNARCDHCFMRGKLLNRDDLIDGDIFSQILGSFLSPIEIFFTGGEPFMREDILDLITVANNSKQVNAITVCTNGILTDKIIDVLAAVSPKLQKKLIVQISLDAMHESHDLVRGVPGAFEAVIKTIDFFKTNLSQYSLFSYVVNIASNGRNSEKVKELIDFLCDRKISSYLSVIRGNDFGSFGLPGNIAESDYNPARGIVFDSVGFKKLIRDIEKDHPGYFNPFQNEIFSVTFAVMERKARVIKCLSPDNSCIIHCNGDISLCEQVRPFGNLRSWGWDVNSAYNSFRAFYCRLKLQRCACINSCAITYSLGKEFFGSKKVREKSAYND